MREIKFRAWVDHSDKWNDCKPRMIYFDEKFPDLLLHPRTGEIWFNGDDDTSKKMDSKIELMQYTGLKDKNGKEIFEGDVLEFIDPSHNRDSDHGFGWCGDLGTKVVVVFDEDHAEFGLYRIEQYKQNKNLLPTGSSLDLCKYGLVSYNKEITIGAYAKIIGNICENPELLESK